MDKHSVGMMLQPGESRIFPSFDYESRVGCGLIPLGSDTCKVATTGYKWNLGKFDSPRKYAELSFKRFISTSNAIVSDSLCVDSN